MSDLLQLALRFISGKYQGGEFPLKADRDVVIGRSSDLDMVLVEDMVSRRHAKISAAQGQVSIEDLGSTNGTFVNGEKIKRVRLREGDRILIGTSIMKLISMDESRADALASPGEEPHPQHGDQGRASTSFPGRRTVTSARSMAGTIDEIPLPDLLQLLSTSKKSGVLQVQHGKTVGRIFMRQGQIYYAKMRDNDKIGPRKAIYRMLVWETGGFELQPQDNQTFEDELTEATGGLLMEAMRQLDEIRRLEEDLPGHETALRLCSPIEKPLRELSPEQLDMLQLVHNHGKVGDVLDNSPTPDLETYTTLIELTNQRVICA
jgi:hypothetical protein